MEERFDAQPGLYGLLNMKFRVASNTTKYYNFWLSIIGMMGFGLPWFIAYFAMIRMSQFSSDSSGFNFWGSSFIGSIWARWSFMGGSIFSSIQPMFLAIFFCSIPCSALSFYTFFAGSKITIPRANLSCIKFRKWFSLITPFTFLCVHRYSIKRALSIVKRVK